VQPEHTVARSIGSQPEVLALADDSGLPPPSTAANAQQATMTREVVAQPAAPALDLARTSIARAFRNALPALVLSLVWIIAWYWSTGEAMVRIWERSDTFVHGFVVPPIVLWLFWRQRAQLSLLTPRPNWWTLAPLAVAGFGWLLGELAAVNAVSQLALTIMLVLTVPAMLGLKVARTVAFPLSFLFFAVPIGEFVMPQLMEWTADFTIFALRASGIPVYREGLHFVIPSGNWSVVEACSGIRYLIASLMVGTLYAYLSYRSLSRRLIFMGFAILVPIIANWLRAYMIVMIGHLSGNTLAVGVDHLLLGWVFFGVVITILFAIGARWREDLAADAIPVAPRSSAREESGTPGRFWFAALAVGVVASVWQIAYRAIELRDVAAPPQLAAVTGDWQSAPGGLTGWRPRFANTSAELHRTFRNERHVVGLYVGYYRNQDYGRKMVSSENVLVGSLDTAWTQIADKRHDVPLDRQPVQVRAGELRGANGEELVLWQWYWINGRLTTSEPWAKAYTALSRLQGQGDDSAVVIVYARKGVPEGSQTALEAFTRAYAAPIEAALRQTRETR